MRIARSLIAAAIISAMILPSAVPASAATPLPLNEWYALSDDYFDGSDEWYDWYYGDYHIPSEGYDGFYTPSTNEIYFDGSKFTAGSAVISSDDGFTTIIPSNTAETVKTDENGYPDAPSSWQGGTANPGGGGFTNSSSILQANGQLGSLVIKNKTIRVYEGTSDSNLLNGAGHFTGTSAWDGNVCLAGHNRGPNAWFYDLINLRSGDVILYRTALGSRTYVVNSIRTVSINDLSPLNGSDTNMLTLVTCLANQPSVRLIVQAQAI